MPAAPNRSAPAFALANAALTPIIEWVNAVRGRKTQLVRAVQTAAFPAVLTRNVIESWLVEDEEKRVQPLFSNGLLLLEVWKTIQQTPNEEHEPEQR